MATTSEIDGESFAEQTALVQLLGDHPKVKMLAVLLSEGRDISVSQIAEQAGMSRSTVYKHIDDLQQLNVIEKTRELGGSPLYQLNRGSEVAKNIGQLEWALLDEFEVDGE